MLDIFKEHRGFWRQILVMARLDLQRAYKGTLLGSAWAVLKPLITLAMFWFVFFVGIRVGNEVQGVPRFVFMLVGFIPWFYMSDMIKGGAKCIRKNAHLVTKVAYPVSTIMTFTAISRVYINILLTVIMYIYLWICGFGPSIYNVQFFYYFIMMFFFFLALSWTTATFCAYSKDLENTIDAAMQALFWLSGVIWNIYDIEIGWLQIVMLFNPINYFVNGYRKAFLYGEWFWQTPLETGIFLFELLLVIIVGSYNYKRLRKTMSDVL